MRTLTLATLVLLPLSGCFATPPESPDEIGQPVLETTTRATLPVGNRLAATVAEHTTPNAGIANKFVGGFCAGTSVEGTCVAAFFQPIAGCFAPQGSCVIEADHTTYTNICWEDGSKALWGQQAWQWSNPQKVCLDAVMTFPSQDGEWIWNFTRGDQVLSYEWQNGAVTCPDGSQITIQRDCPAIIAYMKPGILNCTEGACQ